ncbi:Hypothetical predicted protein [Lecanosticta acicola]|uniref:Uncharacterized protein n=1 Tax=Lecanosticta acicola TaxID=111012 RepID=A0AAI8YVL5_9PEZI|nr:Hypothetical predicted protein [Lecanosticta acicola]
METPPTKGPYTSLDGNHSWQPGIFRRIPWSGISALFGAFCANIAAIAILVASDGNLITAWKYSPTVYLSVSYTISNSLIAAAFSEAVTLNWWMKAIKQGTSLGDLHRYWRYGTAPMAALLSGRYFNFVAFAAVFVAITPINGPLLQRSSSVSDSTIYSLVNLSFPAAKVIVRGTGYISGRAYDVPLFTDEYNPVVQAYYRNDAMPADAAGCPANSQCSGRMIGAGLSATCESSTAPFNAASTLSNGSINFATTDVFQSKFYWSASRAPGNVSLNIQYKNTAPCTGNLIVKNCTLQAATVRYPIVIDGQTSTISLDSSTDIFDDEVLNTTEYSIQIYGSETPIGGYAFALSSRYNTITHLMFSGAAGYTLSSDGPSGPQFANMEDITDTTMGFCKIKFKDPTPFLLQQARELMFRTALAQGNSSTLQAINPASEAKVASVYTTHYPYMAGAVVINMLAIMIVLAMFKGYWHLGRNISMSPLEIARAFNAPLLADQNSNAVAIELVSGADGKPVRYGLVAGPAAAQPHISTQLWKGGEVVEMKPLPSRGPSPGALQQHLEIADSRIVEPLRT